MTKYIDISPEAVERLRIDLLAFDGAEYTRFGGTTLTEKSAATLRALSAALEQSRAVQPDPRDAVIKRLVEAAKPFAQVRIKDGVSQAGDIGRTDVTNIRAALANMKEETK